MNLKLLSLLVKDFRDTDNAHVRTKCASAASGVGILSNILLSVMKIIIGIISDSIAIIADAVNNIADAASSVITLVGFKLASKPADREHPYGHRRIEYITGLIVSMVICVLGLEFFISSIDAIIHPAETEYSTLSLVILTVSVAVKLWQSLFYKAVGKHISSTALIATASDSRNDVISTAAVLAGALISKFSGINLDGWLGLAVACFIIRSGIGLVMETADPLLGTPPSRELVASIGKKIMSYEGVLGYHDLMVHDYGSDRIFASVHLEVPAEQDILVSHDLSDNIELDFRREPGIYLVIHLDPVITRDEEIAELRREVEAVVALVTVECGYELSMHDFRVVRGAAHTNLIFDVAVPFECKLSDGELCTSLDKRIRMLCPEYNSVITCDRCYISTTAGMTEKN
ncbi:MAG: cation transporter [Clostridia bacterium]|nr:cation transporter [Clostridia bacterium]